uniref:Uncharacterized protein n=1 Tax=Glossina palpalis gambiensis TaxID=67801 RepID=A0A1B0BVI1_9MUSC
MGSCYVLFYMKICKLMPSSLELRGSNLFQYFFALSASNNFLPFKVYTIYNVCLAQPLNERKAHTSYMRHILQHFD